MKKIIFLCVSSALFFACNKETAIPSNPESKSEIKVAFAVNNITDTGHAATDDEKKISTATIVLYDKNGKYLQEKVLTTESSHTFTNIDEALFPVKLFTVANNTAPWELKGVTAWNNTTTATLNSLSFENKATNSVLHKGATPLPMYAEATATRSGAVQMTLQRCVALVTITNNSTYTFDYVGFKDLNNKVNLSEVDVNSGAFTFQEQGITFAPNSSRSYYLMPTSASQVTLTLKSGNVTKSAKLNKLMKNYNHPCDIVNDNININITIGAPNSWDTDTTVEIK